MVQYFQCGIPKVSKVNSLLEIWGMIRDAHVNDDTRAYGHSYD